LRRARDRAKTGEDYVVQLPRESWAWVVDAVQYWRSFGNEIANPVTPIQPPPALKELETRAVAIRPEVILSCESVDLNVVFERFDRSATTRFDLIIATNVFLYYDTLQQALALQNISTLLKRDGFLLTNDWCLTFLKSRCAQLDTHRCDMEKAVIGEITSFGGSGNEGECEASL
jgi:hypothetical protein